LKQQLNSMHEGKAEVEVVLGTCINELREVLNVIKVQTGGFSAIDEETKA